MMSGAIWVRRHQVNSAPPGRRARGWQAGLLIAGRQDEQEVQTARVEGVRTAPGT